MRAQQGVSVLIELIIIVHQAGNMYQPFNTVLQFDKHSEGSDAGNNSVEFFADMAGHIFCFFQIDRSTFCFCSRTFTDRGMFGDRVKVQFQLFAFLVIHCRVAHPFMQQTVHYQVRITPDRRCEMRVILCRQAKVPNILGLINSLFQRT